MTMFLLLAAFIANLKKKKIQEP